MKVASLFAGIGGFDLALTRLGHEIVYVNEWDKYAVQTYEKNFNHKPDTRDITTVPTSDIPKHDILVGGFPCQAFSITGKRRGFAETRGTLFFDIARILKDKKPACFILENVKGLLSHDNGNTFKTIISTLDELGYNLQWQVLNSKNFGVPQNRERVFIVGHLRGEPRPQVFPIAGNSGAVAPGPITSQQWKNRSTGSLYVAKVGTYRTHKDGYGFREVKSGLAPTIPARAREDGSGRPVIRVNNSQDGKISNMDGVSFTLSSGHYNQPKIEDNMQIRRLTPIECERLQGFPDNWTEGVSDTQRYKQLGNAVTVNVVYEIAKRL